MLGEPLERLLARRIEHDAALVHEHDAIAAGEGAGRTLLGDEHGTRQMLDQVEERLCSVRIELRRRFVQQQEPGSQCERRGERHALQLSAGQLTGEAIRERFRADESQGLVHPRPDLVGRHADVLEAEGDLVRHLGHHDLILRILEHRGDDAGELRRARLPRVDPADDDAAREDTAVEVRDEPRERPQERRLPRTRRAEQGDMLAVADLQRHVLRSTAAPAP